MAPGIALTRSMMSDMVPRNRRRGLAQQAVRSCGGASTGAPRGEPCAVCSRALPPRVPRHRRPVLNGGPHEPVTGSPRTSPVFFSLPDHEQSGRREPRGVGAGPR